METRGEDDAAAFGQANSSDSSSSSAAAGESKPVAANSASSYTPLFRAQNEDRYLRRKLIREYQVQYQCRLVIMIDQIAPDSVTYFAELLHDADPKQDLHLILCSPGGDGETAVRLVRMAQRACKELTVVVPENAKSAATILALGAHHVLMGPTSDLGPIDPQINVAKRGFVSAKDLIAAVDRALDDVAKRPDTYPLHTALLGGIDAPAVEGARSALDRTAQLARLALGSNPDRSQEQIDEMADQVRQPFVDEPSYHGAVIGSGEATKAGLPIKELSLQDPHWEHIWNLWTRYFVLGDIPALQVYEGEYASQVKNFAIK
ncbi:SDH family Clp fold serine proteinase [Saccharopolyspora sp. NPDC002578]